MLANLYSSNMTNRIGFRSRTNVSSLDISDDNKTFALRIVTSLFEGFHSLNTKLLIHSNLWLHCRNQVISCINNALIELPDCFAGTF